MRQPREDRAARDGSAIDITDGSRADDRPLHTIFKSQLVVRASTARLEA